MAEAGKRKMPPRVAFRDEARIGRIGDPRRRWAPRPMRPSAPAQMVGEHAHVFGAAGPAGGRRDSLILPYADTGAMPLFLKEVAGRRRGERILMFMDRAGWHRSGRLKVPPNMKPAFLPPHSPEPDPQEQVWDGLREKSLANRLFIPSRVKYILHP
jgi:hypothetical protein